MTPDPTPQPVVWNWPNRRSRVTHAYVRGNGYGDGSLCGQPFDPTGKPSIYANDPKCTKCRRLCEVSDA